MTLNYHGNGRTSREAARELLVRQKSAAVPFGNYVSGRIIAARHDSAQLRRIHAVWQPRSLPATVICVGGPQFEPSRCGISAVRVWLREARVLLVQLQIGRSDWNRFWHQNALPLFGDRKVSYMFLDLLDREGNNCHN
jgi:hypothetical protein